MEKPKIIIEIKGGTVVSTYTSRDMDIYIIDHDNLAMEDIHDTEKIDNYFDNPYAPDYILIREDDFDSMLKEIREEFEMKEVGK